MTLPATPRAAKIAYVVAQEIKYTLRDRDDYVTKEEFQALLSEARERFGKFSDRELDREVERDNRPRNCPVRCRRLNSARFVFGLVPLEQCSVWNEMGERNWASGPVPKVVRLYEQRGEKDAKFERMVHYARDGLYSQLPIIVMRREKNPNQFRIDDGCHRSVAMWMAGVREVKAFVGVASRDKIWWKWEGN